MNVKEQTIDRLQSAYLFGDDKHEARAILDAIDTIVFSDFEQEEDDCADTCAFVSCMNIGTEKISGVTDDGFDDWAVCADVCQGHYEFLKQVLELGLFDYLQWRLLGMYWIELE